MRMSGNFMRMSRHLFFLTFFIFWIFFYSSEFSIAFEIPPFAKRINLRCPVKIETLNNKVSITKDPFSEALCLYDIIEERLKNAKNNKGVYRVDINNNMYFVIYAKSNFKIGELSLQLKNPTTKNMKPLKFLNVFFVQTIDFDNNRITMIRRSDGLEYTITIPDFEKAFLWYTDLIDAGRVFIPVYGFLSIPNDSKKAVNVYTTWKKDKKVFRRSIDNELQYDFYKVLDYKNGFYLLGISQNEYYFEKEKKDWGIIGWVKEKFVVLWRSRYYFHPLTEVSYYNENMNKESKESEIFQFSNVVNQLYFKQDFPIVDSTYMMTKSYLSALVPFYKHFGFPELYPPYTADGPYIRVCILNPFRRQILDELIADVKKNIHVSFLLDTSKSMVPFKGFIESFHNEFNSSRKDEFGLYFINYFTFNDSSSSDNQFKKIDDIDDYDFIIKNIEFGSEKKDYDYKEPLITSIEKSIIYIKEQLKNLKHYVKILFIITDAGPNDYTKKRISEIKRTVNDFGIVFYFIIPDAPLISGKESIDDSPEEAYKELKKLISEDFLQKQSKYYKLIQFSNNRLSDIHQREELFKKNSKDIVKEIKMTINKNFEDTIYESNNRNSNIYLTQFVPLQLLKEIKEWKEVDNAQILGHMVKYIKFINNESQWDTRIAIPFQVMDTYIKATRDGEMGSTELFKKIFIVNSLISVSEVKKCEDIYEQLNNYVYERKDNDIKNLWQSALLGKNLLSLSLLGHNSNIKDISITKIDSILKERLFYFNESQKNENKYIYLRKNELFY